MLEREKGKRKGNTAHAFKLTISIHVFTFIFLPPPPPHLLFSILLLFKMYYLPNSISFR